MAFDLEYRPLLFSDVLGNDVVRRLLLTRSKARTLADQSMLFSGPKGCGKTTLARIVARAIKCSDLRDGEPCNECQSCLSILEETNRDVEELDAASQGTVDRVKDMIKDSEFGTFDGTDTRVYVVDEAQRLSKPAQDAFLKAIESRSFIIIMCTTEPGKIQGPIVDRVEQYPISSPSAQDLVLRLRRVCSEKSISADDLALDQIVSMCQRTPRSSLMALESMASLGPVTTATVGAYYRLESYEAVNRFLSSLDSDLPLAMKVLDELSFKESASWVSDAIKKAIVGANRSAIGYSSNYPVPTTFFHVRGRDWLTLASDLASIDRPTIADVEALAMLGSRLLPAPAVAPPAPASLRSGLVPPELPPAPAPPPAPPPLVVSAPAPAPAPKAAPAVTPSPSVEIDGVLFSKEESLTSLDSKIVKTQDPGPERPSVRVESDKSRVPIPESEFATGLRDRLRRH